MVAFEVPTENIYYDSKTVQNVTRVNMGPGPDLYAASKEYSPSDFAGELEARPLGPTEMLVGNVSGGCMRGFYYVTPLADTNLYLLAIENARVSNAIFFFCDVATKYLPIR